MMSRVAALLSVLAAGLWTGFGLNAGTDEFGRATLGVLLESIGYSLLRGLQLVVPLMLMVTLIVAASETYGWRRLSAPVRFLLDSIESVPAYLWVLAAVGSASQFPALAGNVALAIVLFPLAYATLKGVCTEIMRQPFITSAILSGLPRYEILRRHVLPHVVTPATALMLNLLGAAIALYGALGAFGFSNRQTLDLGTLLLRGKEQAPLDPSLLWLTLGGFCLVYASLVAASRLFLRHARFSGAAPSEGGSHLIWMRDSGYGANGDARPAPHGERVDP